MCLLIDFAQSTKKFQPRDDFKEQLKLCDSCRLGVRIMTTVDPT